MIRVDKNIYQEPTGKSTGAYIVKIKKSGVKINRSFSYSNPEERKLALLQAQAFRAAETKSILLTGETATKTSLLTLQSVSLDYEKDEDRGTPSKKGADIEQYRIDKLRRDFPLLFSTPIEKLSKDDFGRMVAKMKKAGLNASTINRNLSMFGSFFKYAATKQGQTWVPNLVAGLSLKTKTKDLQNFEHSVFQRIIDETESDILKLALEIGMETGMRRGEITKLIWRHVKLDHSTPHIEVVESKNGESRIIPISASLKNRLAEIEDKAGLPLSLFWSSCHGCNSGTVMKKLSW